MTLDEADQNLIAHIVKLNELTLFDRIRSLEERPIGAVPGNVGHPANGPHVNCHLCNHSWQLDQFPMGNRVVCPNCNNSIDLIP